MAISYYINAPDVATDIAPCCHCTANTCYIPSVTKFSKEQNDLKMKELQEYAANTAVGQYELNLHVLGLNYYSTEA